MSEPIGGPGWGADHTALVFVTITLMLMLAYLSARGTL